MNTIPRTIFRAGVAVLALACTSHPVGALAQADESFSDHLTRLATPLPAAYHAPTQRLLIAEAGDVSAHAPGASVAPPQGERIYGNPTDTILRLRIDERRERLWILASGVVRVIDLGNRRVVASVALPGWFHTIESTNCLPDLKIEGDGAAILSDSVQPKLWRIDGTRFSVHERSVTMPSHAGIDAGFSALSIEADRSVLAAVAVTGSLWRITADRSRAERVRLAKPIHGACALERVSGSRRPSWLVLKSGRGSLRLDEIVMEGSGRAALRPLDAAVRLPASLLNVNGAAHLALAQATDRALRPRYETQLALVPIGRRPPR